MADLRITPVLNKLEGDLQCPPDKSFSHRAAMVGAIAQGETQIENFSFCQDTWSTLSCLQLLGIEVKPTLHRHQVKVISNGWESLREPMDILNVENSGTTMRMLAGITAGIDGLTILSGDHSIRQRPMKRIIDPLRKTGGVIGGRNGDRYAPP